MIKILFLALCFTQNCKDQYLDRVLESKNLARYFLVVKVSINKKENDILVLNYNLYNFLKGRDSALENIENYKLFVKEKLRTNEAININPEELARMGALVIKDSRKVQAIAAGGEKTLFNRYLDVFQKHNYARLKPKIKHIERIAVVKRLFEWNFFIESVEGDFSVPELNFCGGI